MGDAEEMKSGVDLDVLIAEKIMGCQVKVDGGTYLCNCTYGNHARTSKISLIKSYSYNIESAWDVVKKLDTFVQVGYSPGAASGDPTACRCMIGFPLVLVHSYAETAELAICRAALKYRDYSENEKVKIKKGW